MTAKLLIYVCNYCTHTLDSVNFYLYVSKFAIYKITKQGKQVTLHLTILRFYAKPF